MCASCRMNIYKLGVTQNEMILNRTLTEMRMYLEKLVESYTKDVWRTISNQKIRIIKCD